MHHYDWTGAGASGSWYYSRGGNADEGDGIYDRVTSFLVWVQSDCLGGGTDFPRLKISGGRAELCRRGWIECPPSDSSSETSPSSDAGEESPDAGVEGGGDQGVIFRPIAGNAIFWENLRKDGTGYEETWHAGLPVESGTKVGLNIWSWGRF